MSTQAKPQEKSQAFIFGFMGIMLVTGSINTIANKLQQNIKIQLDGKDAIYKCHQKFITFCMFLGESLCNIFYLIQKRMDEKKKEAIIPDVSKPLAEDQNEAEAAAAQPITETEQQKVEPKQEKPQAKFYYFFLPAFCDLLGTSTSSISLTFLASSVYQMFRGAVIIFTATASFFILKNKIYRHQLFGISIVVVGLTIVGLNSVLNSEGKMGDNPLLGIILVLTAQLFSASLFIVEETLLVKFDTPALKVVGFEGLCGVSIYLVLMVVFYNVSCDKWGSIKTSLCPKDLNVDHWRFENGILAVRKIINNPRLLIVAILYITSIAFFNFAGLSITKYVSSVARTIVDTLRTIVIWIVFLLPYVPEATQEHFTWLQLLGFSILVTGSVIYNEIVEIPCFGCNKNTKRARREEERTKLLKEEVKAGEEEKQREEREYQEQQQQKQQTTEGQENEKPIPEKSEEN